jgi:hypothetical protein
MRTAIDKAGGQRVRHRGWSAVRLAILLCIALGAVLVAPAVASAVGPYTVTGTVTDAGGGKISGVVVTAYDVTGNEADVSAVTDSSGYYTLDTTAQEADVYFDATARNISRTTYFIGAATYWVWTDGAVVDKVLSVGGAIRGKVTKTSGGDLGRIDACAYPASWQTYDVPWYSAVGYARSVLDGTYVMFVPAGTYRVMFDDATDAFLGAWWDTQGDWGSADDVVVPLEAYAPDANQALQASGSIMGTVEAAGPTLLDGLRVVAVLDGNEVAEASTGVTGEYSITGLASGSYRVVFDTSGYNDTNSTSFAFEWFDDTYKDDATPVDVVAGGAPAVASAVLGEGGTISGTVTYGGAPVLTGGTVYVDNYDYWSMYGGTSLSGPMKSDGSFSVSGVPFGNVYVRAEPLNDDTTDTNYLSAETTALLTPAVTPLTGVELELAMGASVEGTVTASATGLGAKDIGAQLFMAEEGNLGWGLSGVTDSLGHYHIRGIVPGRYSLRVGPDAGMTSTNPDWGLMSEYLNGSTGFAAQPTVLLAAGDHLVRSAGLERGGSVEVTSSVNPPSEGYLIPDSAPAWTDPWRQAAYQSPMMATDVLIEGVRPGTYRVYTNNSSVTVGTVTVTGTEAHTVTVPAPTGTAGGAIEGTVVDGSGLPLTGIAVSVFDSAGVMVERTETVDGGMYAVSSALVEGESYKIMFSDLLGTRFVRTWHGGTSFSTATPVTALDMSTPVKGVGATMSGGGGTITGSFLMPEGTLPVWNDLYEASACELIAGEWVPVASSAISYKDGSYSIGCLPAGTYKVSFTQPESGMMVPAQYYPGVLGHEQAQSFAVVGTGTTTVPSYTLSYGLCLYPMARTAAWDTLYGVQTEVYQKMADASWARVGDADLGWDAFSNATGERHTHALAGDYKILFKKPGYRSVWYGGASTMGAATVMHLEMDLSPFALQEMTPLDASGPLITSGATEGQAFVTSAAFDVTAADADSGLTGMKVTLDGAVVASLTLDPVTVKTRTVSVSSAVLGAHTVVVTATNQDGVVSSKAVNFSVVTAAPAVAPTSVTIKTNATTTRIGGVPILSGAVTTTGLIGKNMVVYVMKPGSRRWTYSSNRTVYSLGGAAAWQYKYTFKKGMKKGVYVFKAVVPAMAGFLASTSPTTVSIRLR